MSLWESLQERLNQTTESVTRSSRVDIVSGGVDEIDPPEELDEYAEQAKTTGPVRKNLRQFINDVWEPGYRVTAESQTTEDYFMGGEEAPEGTPEDGFLSNAGVYAGERYSDFYDFGKETTWQRWVRGTILVEQLKNDPEDPESVISGFYHIRPETIYARVENNKNILLPPDREDLPDDVDDSDIELTPRGEVAAYIQFDDESILGLRNNGFDEQDIPLSQNDVMKQTLEPDIGDNAGSADQQGIFGTSIIEGISEDITEYKQIKRDRAEAISRKAYGVWTAQFTPEVIDLGDRKELIEWTDDQIGDTEDELIAMGPGDVLTSDAGIDLKKHDAEVPDLVETVNQLISIMLAPLPAPKYMIGFAEGINRDISEEQKEAYLNLVSEERRYQEKKWTPVLQKVARRQGLPNPESLELHIEPEQEENPTKSLSTEEIDRMNTYIKTLNEAAGPQAGPTSLVDRESLLEVLDFPVEEIESGDVVDEIAQGDEAAQEAWEDIMGVEALASFSEGTWVDTPDGKGLVEDTVSEGTVSGMDASEESVVVVAMLEESGVNFYRESEISEGSPPETAVDEPTDDLEAMANIAQADSDVEALQFGEFDYPESWKKSDTPNRAILLKAYAGMGGSFTGCRNEGLRADLCASIKDAVLGTHDWRGGWAD